MPLTDTLTREAYEELCREFGWEILPDADLRMHYLRHGLTRQDAEAVARLSPSERGEYEAKYQRGRLVVIADFGPRR